MPNSATPRHRPPPRRVTVARTQRLGPRTMRVTLKGVGLDGFSIGSPTGHIKLFLPGDGDRQPTLPHFGPNGIEWPTGRTPSIVRTYTPRRFDPHTHELDVDFVLHGDGPAARWAASTSVGDHAAIAGPGRGYNPDPEADWFLLAGDESAIPAIATLIDAVPEGAPAHVVIEVESEQDEQPLPDHQGLTTQWLHRDGRPPGQLLEQNVRDATPPHGDGRTWVAGEATVIRAIRRHLLTDKKLPAKHLVTRGYWRAGHPGHPDHDDGDDPT